MSLAAERLAVQGCMCVQHTSWHLLFIRLCLVLHAASFAKISPLNTAPCSCIRHSCYMCAHDFDTPPKFNTFPRNCNMSQILLYVDNPDSQGNATVLCFVYTDTSTGCGCRDTHPHCPCTLVQNSTQSVHTGAAIQHHVDAGMSCSNTVLSHIPVPHHTPHMGPHTCHPQHRAQYSRTRSQPLHSSLHPKHTTAAHTTRPHTKLTHPDTKPTQCCVHKAGTQPQGPLPHK